MSGIVYALITVFAWGTWLAPSQKVAFPNQQIKTFYVGAANLLLATVVVLLQGFQGLTWQVFWLPFVGGLVWSVSGFLAFTATDRLGIARAFGIWAPVNVIVSVLWGALLFGELLAVSPQTRIGLGLALLINLTGVLMIVFAKGFGEQSTARANFRVGLLSALGAGVLWGSYFIPIKISAASLWVAAFPLSVGIFTGSLIMAALSRQSFRLNSRMDTLRVTATGLLWGIGNSGLLLLVDTLGAGRGFTISQLGVVVNGLIGVYLLRDPQPNTRAALLTLVGCVFATIGGILMGSL